MSDSSVSAAAGAGMGFVEDPALEVMGADVIGAGASGFTGMSTAETFLNQDSVDTPSALSDILTGSTGASTIFESALFSRN